MDSVKISRDRNEPDIITFYESRGCLVEKLTQGAGLPDLLVALPIGANGRRRFIVVEVKDEEAVPSARKLTEKQVLWHAKWADAPVFVVLNVDDAARTLGDIE